MPISGWYQTKAEQCERLAVAATDPVMRAKYEEEAILWRGIAKDVDRRERNESSSVN